MSEEPKGRAGHAGPNSENSRVPNARDHGAQKQPAQDKHGQKTNDPNGRQNRDNRANSGPIRRSGNRPSGRKPGHRFAALDLGTNNCRLLIAAPRGRSFRIIDAFSRIVRLGEGLSQTGALSEAAQTRAIEALKVCAEKVRKRDVTRGRYIATQACRAASNGAEFLDRVKEETGLEFEVIPTAEEARLSVRGCSDLVDPKVKAALIFDIGGGSTELSWVRPRASGGDDAKSGGRGGLDLVAWTSLPIGVVNLSEKWGGRDISKATYEEIVESVRTSLREIDIDETLGPDFRAGHAHLLGTSGTVTSIAGVHLGLSRYRRDAVDGLWLDAAESRRVSERLRAMPFEVRASEPCIGRERADLVVCGCAILEALLREWPSDRIRVADRGLREGILAGLSASVRKRRRGRRHRGGKSRGNSNRNAPRTGDDAGD